MQQIHDMQKAVVEQQNQFAQLLQQRDGKFAATQESYKQTVETVAQEHIAKKDEELLYVAEQQIGRAT